MGLTQKLGTIPLAILTDASNNVGIGAAPSGSYKLEVTGTAKVSSTLLLGGALTGTSADFLTTTASRYLQIRDAGTSTPSLRSVNDTIAQLRAIAIEAHTISLRTGASSGLTVTEALAISATGAATFSSSVNVVGNVSITDTSSFGGQAKLFSRITADATTVGKITDSALHIWNTTNVGSLSQITFGYTNGATTNASVYLGLITTNGSGSGFGDFVLGTAPSANVQCAERMRITSGGNVGIGTSSPYKLLTVSAGAGGTVVGQSEILRIAGTSQVIGNKNEIGFANYANNYNASVTLGAVITSTADYLVQDFYIATRASSTDIAATERMRITSGGNVGIGVTPSAWSGRTVLQVYNGGVNWGSASGTGGSTGFYNNGYWNGSADKAIAAGYAQILALNDNGSGRVQVLTTSGTYSADATVSYVQGPYVAAGGNSWTNGSSDVRKKKNFEPSQGLAELLQIEAIKYHFKWEDDNVPKRLGFKAQNLQGLISEMVVPTGDKAEDGSDYLSIIPDYILPVFVKAIQEFKAEIDELKNK